MSSTYNGQAGNVSQAASVAIASTSNTSPIIAATSAAHNRVTGDTVVVYGHQTNVGANGTWIVTVVDSTHLSLNGSITSGSAGGATGTVDALAFAAPFTQPSDGDASNASATNTPADGLADRSAALLLATGKYKLADITSANHDGGGSVGTSASSAATGAGAAFVSLFNAGSLINVQTNDILEIDIHASLAGAAAGGIYAADVRVSNVAPGVAASYNKVTGSQNTWTQNGTNLEPVSLKGYRLISTNGRADVALFGASSIGVGASTITVYDDWIVTLKLWRPTFVAAQ